MGASHTKASIELIGRQAEDNWIYEQRLRYRTYGQIALLAKAPIIRNGDEYALAGGIGRTIGVTTIHRRIKARMAEGAAHLSELVADYRTAELARLDALSATLVAQIDRMSFVITNAGYLGMIDVHAEQIVQKATVTLARTSAQRASLLGLNAPIEVAVEHTVYDAEAAELQRILDDAAAAKPKAKR